ncbi:hypothetical protein HSIEG1_19 [Enterococcus sp. HSIEG1]|nr:hypothetical protein HSIEG1_19 [Enterococcus sp. HSIEG1]
MQRLFAAEPKSNQPILSFGCFLFKMLAKSHHRNKQRLQFQ